MPSTYFFKFLYASALLLPFTSTSGAQAPLAAEVPKNPEALLQLAAKANGLQDAAMPPWHLVATVRQFDDNGVEKQSGTYEEYWVAPHRYKILYSSGSFQQTALRTEEGIFLSGSEGPVPEFLLLDSSLLLAPIPAVLPFTSPANDKLERIHTKSGELSMDCLTLTYKNTSFGDMSGPSYCLSSPSAMLRAVTNHGGISQTLFNQLAQINGHIVAHSIVEYWNKKKRLEIQVSKLATLTQTDAVEVTAPVTATRAPDHFVITSGSTVNRLLKKIPPNYPIEAKSRRVQGKVVLHARISETGEVLQLTPVSGPTPLMDAAIHAVQQWRYQPYILYGEAHAIETEINVIFTLG